MGRSISNNPFSINCAAIVAVIDFEILAIRITLFPVHFALISTSAKPKPVRQRSFPSTETPIDTPGTPLTTLNGFL